MKIGHYFLVAHDVARRVNCLSLLTYKSVYIKGCNIEFHYSSLHPYDTIKCMLHSTSYAIDFSFDYIFMFLQIINVKILHEIPCFLYPTYSATNWADFFSDLLETVARQLDSEFRWQHRCSTTKMASNR